jgi:hypothetical protein
LLKQIYKIMKLNFREENVDRFLEIMATAKKFGKFFNFAVLNMPSGYASFINSLDLTMYRQSVDCYVYCSENKGLRKMFTSSEDLREIEKRINTYQYLETKVLDKACDTLLSTAIDRLNLTTDQIITCIELAEVISSMEGSEIRCEHMAEAIQYVDNTKL